MSPLLSYKKSVGNQKKNPNKSVQCDGQAAICFSVQETNVVGDLSKSQEHLPMAVLHLIIQGQEGTGLQNSAAGLGTSSCASTSTMQAKT